MRGQAGAGTTNSNMIFYYMMIIAAFAVCAILLAYMANQFGLGS